MIRVLRVIEYVYPDIQTYYEDKHRWTTSANHRGVKFQSTVVSECVVEPDGTNSAEKINTESG